MALTQLTRKPSGAVPGQRSVGEPPPARPSGLLPALVAAGSLLLVAGWAGGAWISADRGFDITDESFYLLSYRWWDVHLHSFTAFQYVFGPLFDLLGEDIAALRRARTVLVLAAHAAFGWAVTAWLRQWRGARLAHPWWVPAGTLFFAAAGGASHAWMPATPGYNDVMLLAGLAMATVVLRTATRLERGAPVPWWHPLLLGPPAAAALLAKWSAAPVLIGCVGLALALLLWPRGWRVALRLLGLALLGLAAALGVLHVAVAPLPQVVDALVESNKLILSGGSRASSSLLVYYVKATARALEIVAGAYWPLYLATLLLVVARGRRTTAAAAALAGLALLFAVWRTVERDGLTGGARNVVVYVGTLIVALTPVACVGVALLLQRRPKAVGWLSRAVVVALLALLPITLVPGTNIQFLIACAHAYAAWVAVAAVIVTSDRMPHRALRVFVAALTAASVAAAAWLGFSGTVKNRYRTVNYHAATTEVVGVPALAGIRLDAPTAARYQELRAVMAPHVTPPGRPMMGFHGLMGVIYLLDGRPVTEVWNGANALGQARTLRSIEAECRRGPWWGTEKPVLLFGAPPRPAELRTLAACGLSLERDYRLVAPKETTLGLQVYVGR